MSGAVRLRNWVMLTIAMVAMTVLFASSQAHASPQNCSYDSVHAYHGSHMPTDGSTGTDPCADASCASACTVHAVALPILPLVPEAFERDPNCLEPPSRLDGQLPVPGRHPPRSAA